jgi:tRNA uridine 5-carboxymethylaminomethyl modification enzyme
MDYFAGEYDIIVIGAGHAGCEAALACARLNMETLLLTINLDGIALMACNPAIGGTSKGHLVREIDALGGEMGINTDATFIQIKMLNTAKGPAVHSLRAQADKKAYQRRMKQTLENTDHLRIQQAEAIRLITEGAKINGVVTACGAILHAKAVILATGVYLKSKIIIGEYNYSGGPAGLFPANSLSASLSDLGFTLQRFKTGTPARVDRRSVDFSRMEPQYGDEKIIPFSFVSGEITRAQVPCYLAYTNERTHEIIRQNIHRSPLYSGFIEGTGPRYCPSIEDKVVKFPNKERHQLFLEPEGLHTNEIYVQGMSSSLPEEVQIAIYRTIPGMEQVQFMRTAYAIEYDCIDPRQLKLSLESKTIGGLFFAGQINGTSGYEEAAAQGIVAGINAVQHIRCKEPLLLDRADAYAGVLIDDLVTKGTPEPYRMMTSRAEYRLILRQDNADLRLTERGREIGLVDDARYSRFMYKKESVEKEILRLSGLYAPPVAVNAVLTKKDIEPQKGPAKMSDLLKRPEIRYSDVLEILQETPTYDDEIGEEVQTQIKYEGYIDKQLRQVAHFKTLEKKALPPDLDYACISGLRLEARQKLNTAKPENLGQASRISGVSPSDISVLMIYLAKAARQP